MLLHTDLLLFCCLHPPSKCKHEDLTGIPWQCKPRPSYPAEKLHSAMPFPIVLADLWLSPTLTDLMLGTCSGGGMHSMTGKLILVDCDRAF